MQKDYRSLIISVLVLVIIAFTSMVVFSLVSDWVENDKIVEKNITVIGKICEEKIYWGSTKSSIQDSDLIVYGIKNSECQKYEIGNNYTIRYNHIRSSLSGIQYNLVEGV